MVKKKEVKKYYDLLEVSHKSTFEEVRKSYDRLIHLYSDDSIVISPIEEEFSENQRKEIIDALKDAFSQIKQYLKIDSPSEEKPEETAEEPVSSEAAAVPEPEGEEILSEEISVNENIIEITFEDEVDQGISLTDETEPQDGSVVFVDSSEADDFETEQYDDTLKEEPMVEILPKENWDAEDDVAAEMDEMEKELADESDQPADELKHTEETVVEIESEETHEIESSEMEDAAESSPIVEINLESQQETQSLSLKEAREKMGFKVHDIGVALNIPYKILVNIEMEKFHKLPEDGYLRWYITTYAKYLTLDSKTIADDYMKRYREWKKSQDS